MRQNHSERVLTRTTVVLVLFAVAGLATAANRGRYLSTANPLYLFAKAAKMELVDHSANSVPVPTAAVPGIVPPQPEFSGASLVPSEELTLQRIGLSVCFQHRAPPACQAQSELVSH
jgi:hypothetical protein